MRPLVLFLAFLAQLGSATAQMREIDFRFAPASWFSAICLPGDWQKSVITHSGSLGGDFVPGPYARPTTEVTFGVSGHTLIPDSLRFEAPRVPIARAILADSLIAIRQTIFSAIPTGARSPSRSFLQGRLERLDALTGSPAWASPPEGVNPAFHGVAWGVNRPVRYRLKVSPGSSRQVVLGLCEPYKTMPGKRVLLLRVEGAGDLIADPVRDGKTNVPYLHLFAARDIDHNGWLTVEAHAAMESPDPNVILNALWMFSDTCRVDIEALMHGRHAAGAEIAWRCGTELDAQPDLLREDVLLATFPGDTVRPVLTIQTRRQLEFDVATGSLLSEGRPYLRCIPSPESYERVGNGAVLSFPRGTTEAAAVLQHGGAPGNRDYSLVSLQAALDTARAFWMRRSGLPYDRIVLPDSNVQSLLDASIRNLYSIAEAIDGTLQFQPGPSVYRGLWVHDALWHILAALYLGDTVNTRNCVEALLRRQTSSGRVEVMDPYPMNRETPIVLFLACRYARLTDNRDWLERYWPAIQKGNRWLWGLRESTLGDPRSLAHGLFPPGFADGGLGGVTPEYGSVYWGLAGLAATANAARWIGRTEDANLWDDYFFELLASFRRSAARDRRTDQFGNLYLPMMVGDTARSTPPQRANWGIIDAQGVGNVFGLEDSLVTGTLRMLRAVTDEGLAPNTGWLNDGLWPFFGTLEAIAHLWQREDSIAADLLYAIANHASSTWTWVEEQLPRRLGTRTTGDASNATASALFIKLVRRMIILERDSTMDLLAGIPPEWYRAGAHMEVNDVPTLFGRCAFHLDVAHDDSRVTIILRPLHDGATQGTGILNLKNLIKAGFTLRQGKPAPPSVQFALTKGVRLVLTRSQ